MKRFDPQAIKERGIAKLRTYDKWKNLQKDGAAEQFYEALAEPLAENARYGEYLLQELKWDTCRNTSSAKHMAVLVGKKINRKRSAIGFIIVSHSDPEGSKRYSFLGTDNFDIDRESNYDSGAKDDSLTEDFYMQSLVPWISTISYSIPCSSTDMSKRATFTTQSGLVFTCAETKTIKCWQQNWNEIEGSSKNRASFYMSGGWLGYKYLLVPVVQGECRSTVLGTSSGLAGQTFTIATLDIEAADTYYTRQFVKLIETKTDGTEEVWTEIYHLGNASPTEKRFEIDILDDLSGTIIKFGDGINGAIPAEDSTLTLEYLETKGSEGNVYDIFCFQNDVNGADVPSDIPFENFAIGCQNPWPIIGGSDFETFKEFKRNAESAYSNNYEILHTYTELQEKINEISPVPLIKVVTSEFYKETYVNTTKLIKPTIGVSGLSTTMKPLNETEKAIFEETLNESLNSQVLANKAIEYKTPNIIKINSQLNMELKTSVVSNTDFEQGLQENLLALLGRTNIDSIDHYMQSEVLKRALDYSEKIGAIESNDLISIAASGSDLVTMDNTDFHICLKYEMPELQIDSYSKEGYCNKSLVEGVQHPYLFNVSIGSNHYSFMVEEDDAGENVPQIYQSILGDDNYSFYQLNNSKNKFSLMQLKKYKTTFTNEQITTGLGLSSANEADKVSDVSFYVKRYNRKLIGYLRLPLSSIVSFLGFKNYNGSKASALKVYNLFKSNLDNDLCSSDFYFVPTDKTIQSDWNTIFYYDNIEVEIDG